jgi:thioredoxin 1
MVYFYSTTCGFCKQFSPEYNKLAQQMKDKLVFGKLDLPAFPEFGTRYRITHFPELQLFHGGVDLPISYNG